MTTTSTSTPTLLQSPDWTEATAQAPTTEQPTVNPDEERRRRLLEAQAQRISLLQDEISTRQEELDALKAQILDQWEPGTYEAGKLKVQVKEGRRSVNAAKFGKEYPAKAYPECYQLKPLPLSKLEKVLTERAVKPFTTTAKGSVTVA